MTGDNWLFRTGTLLGVKNISIHPQILVLLRSSFVNFHRELASFYLGGPCPFPWVQKNSFKQVYFNGSAL